MLSLLLLLLLLLGDVSVWWAVVTYAQLSELDGSCAVPDVHEGAGRGHEEDVAAHEVSSSSRVKLVSIGRSMVLIPELIGDLESDGHLESPCTCLVLLYDESGVRYVTWTVRCEGSRSQSQWYELVCAGKLVFEKLSRTAILTMF